MTDRVTKMTQNYEAKLRLGAVGRLTEAELNARVGHYRAMAAADDRTLQVVKTLLNSSGVHTIMNPHYHAFSREVGRLARMDATPAAVERAYAQVVQKWAARGLVGSVLLAIGAHVFNLTFPGAPCGAQAGDLTTRPGTQPGLTSMGD